MREREYNDVLTAIGRSRLREIGRAVGEKFIFYNKDAMSLYLTKRRRQDQETD